MHGFFTLYKKARKRAAVTMATEEAHGDDACHDNIFE